MKKKFLLSMVLLSFFLMIGTNMKAQIEVPSNFKASAISTSKIKLTWNEVENATSYNVYKEGDLISNVVGTVDTVAGLDSYTKYCFTVTALSDELESGPSKEKCATTKDLSITVPSNFMIGVIGESKIELTWSIVENALSYNVYKGDENIANIVGNRYVFDYSDENTEYCFSVTSVRNAQESKHSTSSCIIPSKCVTQIDGKRYKDFKDAVDAANASETGATIEIISDFNLDKTTMDPKNGKLTIEKNITIWGNDHILTRGVDYTGTFFTVNSGATLTLDGGLVIDGNNNWTMDEELYNKALYLEITGTTWGNLITSEEGKPVLSAAMFVVNGAVVANNVTIQNSYASGSSNDGSYGIFKVASNATLTMTGATVKHVVTGGANSVCHLATNSVWIVNNGTLITDNFSGKNGGLCRNDSGKFIMNGGTISHNNSINTNGHVIMLYVGSMEMNGGTICSNTGISGDNNGRCAPIYGHSSSKFYMSGGSICHNIGISYGGADLPSSIEAEITGGYIGDNVSSLGNFNADVNGNSYLNITGGTFNQDISQWLSPNCGLIYDEETGHYTVPNNEDENVFVFKNKEDSNWHNADSWSKGSVPSENATVVIASPVVIKSGNVAYADAVSISADITIEDGGQLYHNNQKVNAKFEKTIEGDEIQGDNYVGGWYTISSPMEGSLAFSKVANLTNESYDLYRYNESLEIWENAKVEDNGFTTIESGRGYLYANTEDTELQFSGKLCVKDVNYTLSAEAANLTGFNLIGNPFAHNITTDHFSGAELSDGFYVLSKAGEWGAKLSGSSSVIAPCQGALVQTQQHNAVLTISKNANAKRRSSNGAIAISVSNGKYSDMAYVSFSDGYGLNKINHQNPNAPMIYIPVGGEKFAVAVMDKKVEEIPVAFKAMKMGEYTISAATESCKFSEMYLVDRVTGKETNLNVESYTFIASASDNPERFYIRMSSDASSDNFAFVNNGELIINNVEGEGYIRIFDVMGRPIAECNAYESARISVTTFADGVYIIQKVDDNGVNVQKVMVK